MSVLAFWKSFCAFKLFVLRNFPLVFFFHIHKHVFLQLRLSLELHISNKIYVMSFSIVAKNEKNDAFDPQCKFG